MISVVVADDHPLVREGLRAVLSSTDGYDLVATADTGAAALRETLIFRPDVLVLDVGMPDLSGIEVARRVTKAAPSVNVLMLTMFDDDDTLLAAVRAGALGYVLKGATAEETIRAIAAVAAGEAIFGPGLARRALKLISSPAPEPAFPSLTQRERDVLNSSPPAYPIQQSRHASACPRTRSATTSPASSRNYKSTAEPPRSFKLAQPASVNEQPPHQQPSPAKIRSPVNPAIH